MFAVSCGSDVSLPAAIGGKRRRLQMGSCETVSGGRMKNRRTRPKRWAPMLFVIVLGTLFMGLMAYAAVPEEGDERPEAGASVEQEKKYVGSEACAECHEETYSKWKRSLHARMMQDVKENPDAILGDMSQSLPFSKEDILYTLGNHWTQRYITEIDDEYYVLPRMWSIQSREWLPYSIFSWKKKPWRVYCAGCHSTGYDYKTGTFVETSIGCEACHGPGSLHVESSSEPDLIVNPSKLSKERALMVCESCHVRGRDNSNEEYCFPLNYLPGDDLSETLTPLDMNEGEKVSRALHRIYDEWKEKISQPDGTSCELCQNFRAPNKKAENKRDGPSESMLICHTCHAMAKKVDDHSHHPTEVECTDCHIPSFSKSGESQDIHSHRFQFRTPSKYLEYESCYETEVWESCSACHSDKSINWALKKIGEWSEPPFRKFYKVGD